MTQAMGCPRYVTVGAEADAIVTGDKDLLMLKAFEGIPIIDAAEALKRLGLS
jgi:predicted nucleic acid-binding protein